MYIVHVHVVVSVHKFRMYMYMYIRAYIQVIIASRVKINTTISKSDAIKLFRKRLKGLRRHYDVNLSQIMTIFAEFTFLFNVHVFANVEKNKTPLS